MYLGVGGDFEVDGLALDQLDGLAAQEAGDEVLLDVGRRGNDGGEGRAGSVPMATATSMRPSRTLVRVACGMEAGWTRGDAAGSLGHDVDVREAVRSRSCETWGTRFGGCAQAVAEVLGGVLLALPVHASCLAVVDLHAVHADVALAGAGRG